METKKGKIIYVYDPQCGWCYGFSPVIQKFQKNYSDQLEFEIVSGGMITGDRIGPLSDWADYIGSAYKSVENATGVKFGSGYLDKTLKEGTSTRTSVPPSIALSIFKTLQPENAINFSVEIQKAMYYDGMIPEDIGGYGRLAAKFGIDSTLFVEKMQDETYLKLAEKDFERSRELGVQGFPTVIYQDSDGQLHRLSRGWVSYEELERSLLKVKDK